MKVASSSCASFEFFSIDVVEISFGLFVELVLGILSIRLEELEISVFSRPDDAFNDLTPEVWARRIFEESCVNSWVSGEVRFSNLGELSSPLFSISLLISFGLFVGLGPDVVSFRFEKLGVPIFPVQMTI